MSMDGSMLAQQRDAMQSPGQPAKQNSERVWKLFTDADKAAAIKATDATVRIGSGAEARDVRIRPLNPRALVDSYGLIKEILTPLVATFAPNPDGSPRDVKIEEILAAVGDNIEKVPELIFVILKRGNEISREWIDENLDILIDLQLIIPIFLQQNGLGKLMGNAQAAADPTPPLPTQTNHEASRLTAV